jgi:hypothetical protein
MSEGLLVEIKMYSALAWLLTRIMTLTTVVSMRRLFMSVWEKVDQIARDHPVVMFFGPGVVLMGLFMIFTGLAPNFPVVLAKFVFFAVFPIITLIASLITARAGKYLKDSQK